MHEKKYMIEKKKYKKKYNRKIVIYILLNFSIYINYINNSLLMFYLIDKILSVLIIPYISEKNKFIINNIY